MSSKGTGALSVLRRSSGDMESSLGCVQESRQHVRGILEAVAGCAKYPDTSSAAALDPSDRSAQGSRAPWLTPPNEVLGRRAQVGLFQLSATCD